MKEVKHAQQIEGAVLSVNSHWQKVAMVMTKTARIPGITLPEGDKGYMLIAKQIEDLVRDGRLVAQGDIRKPRHSEVRLAVTDL